MQFETFLTQCQKMFNIFEKHGKPMTDAAKVRFLFSKVQHLGLDSPIEALKAQIFLGGTTVSYVRAANHLSTSLSELPEYVAAGRRGLSLVKTSEKGSDAIYNKDGSIILGFIPSWNKLSCTDKAIVQAERKKIGVKGPKGGGPHKSATESNRLKQLENQNKKYRRAIKSLKSKKIAADLDDDNLDDLDAGDTFGGKNS